ncbi:hypothetical protein [Thalassospira lohafexi]|uniref:TMhelix containing protein n=1 Tax=Thalassospira lohafexi TaxID=744227 RepID=A0A2N3L0T4_9PROT|nr:hypothetical protein [Thalassospira lohafexi]PKR56330.1 hypothetical protein COO92_21225 [Thalassospira lohafexi]
MFGGIGSFFGKLFGTDKALGGIVDGVANSLDKLVYTDEEKAEDHAKSVTEARRMVVDWMAATSGQNLARRLIALAITGVWLGMYLLSVMANMIAVFVETDDKLVELSIIARNSANDMGSAVMLILAFYFAAPHMGDIASAALGKMKTDRGG